MSLLNATKKAAVATSIFISGCAKSPSLPVFGAAFPDWLFCMVGGVLVTIVAHIVLGIYNARDRLQPLSLSYPALVGLSAMLIWLIVFHQ